MNSSAKDAARREREKEHDAILRAAGRDVAALAALVRAREERGPAGQPLELAFAAAGHGAASDEAVLPASVWVALRRGDVAAVLETLTEASHEPFVIDTREELGDGYRLRTVDEVRMLPDVGALRAQLASMLGIPADVVAILGEWGPDDPRTCQEIDLLLNSRFGPVRDAAAETMPRAVGSVGSVNSIGSVDRAPAPAPSAPPAEERPPLRISVAELSDVLQLSAAQARVLSTLVRHATLAVLASNDDDLQRQVQEGHPFDSRA